MYKIEDIIVISKKTGGAIMCGQIVIDDELESAFELYESDKE